MNLYVTILEPYNDVDILFWKMFKKFPRAVVPSKEHHPDNYFLFLENLENLLTIAEIKDVDVVVSDPRSRESRIVSTLSEFLFFLESKNQEEDTITGDLPREGIWEVESIDYNDSFWDVIDAVANPWYEEYNFELPDSGYDKHNIGGSTDINVVSRLAKYGKSTPFINENGLLTDQALRDLEFLMMSEATDADVISFLQTGIDLADKASSKVKDVASKVKDVASKAVSTVSDKAKEAEEKEKEKDKIKISIKNAIDKIKDVDVKKAAKADFEGDENNRDLKRKTSAESNANSVIERAIDYKVSYNALKKSKDDMNRKFKEEKSKLRDKSKADKSKADKE